MREYVEWVVVDIGDYVGYVVCVGCVVCWVVWIILIMILDWWCVVDVDYVDLRGACLWKYNSNLVLLVRFIQSIDIWGKIYILKEFMGIKGIVKWYFFYYLVCFLFRD